MKAITDNDISVDFKSGKLGAADTVISAYGNRLLRSAFLLCKNETDANDLTQETFLQAIKSRHNYNTDYPLFSWLYGILLNLNRQRARKKKFLIFSNDMENNPSPHTTDALHQLDQEKTFSQLYAVMNTLSLKHKEILILKYFEGLKIEEIAVITGASKGTVKSRLHYATKYMQRKMPQHLKEAYDEL